MSWNLSNDSSINAGEIQGIPVNIPPISNNDVLVYDGLNGTFIAENISSAGGITNVISVGSISPVYGVSGGVAELTGIVGDGPNTTATLVNSGHQIQVALNNDITVSSISGKGSPAILNLNSNTILNNGMDPTYFILSNNTNGQNAELGIGNTDTDEGYFFNYVIGTGNLTIDAAPGTPNTGTVTIVSPSNLIFTGTNFNLTPTNLMLNVLTTCTGGLELMSELYDGGGSAGTPNQILFSTGTGISWGTPMNLVILDSLTIQGASGSIALLSLNADNSPGSESVFFLGTPSTNNGYFFKYIPSTGVLSLTPDLSNPSFGDINITSNGNILLNGTNFHTSSSAVTANVKIIGNSGYQSNGSFTDNTGSTGTAGQFLSTTGTGVQWSSASGAVTTIYTGDSVLTGNRTVNQSSYNLDFTGGGNFQISNTPFLNEATYAQNFMTVSDTSGILNSYCLPLTWNSIRFPVNIQNMTLTNNTINLYEGMMVGNATFLIDVYFTLRGTGDASCAHWKVTAGYSASFTGWQTIPMVQAFFDTGSSYILQGNVGLTDPNTIQLRIVRTIWNGTNPVFPGNMIIVRREDDTTSNISSLMDQTPYAPGAINYEIGLQNIYRAKSFNFNGQDITTMGTQTFYYQPGMTLWLSASFGFFASPFITFTQTVSLNFYINGNLMSYSLANIYNVGNDQTLSVANIDLQPGILIQNSQLMNGNNTISVLLNTANGTVVTTNRLYSVTLSMNF